jgi:hypothetical protein
MASGFLCQAQKKRRPGFVLQPDGLPPNQSRMIGDHYEVKVDDEWVPVPNDKINNVVAPDGGAHVCAPRQVGRNKGVLFCVILPSEG